MDNFLVYMPGCRCDSSATNALLFACHSSQFRIHLDAEDGGLRLEVVGLVRAGLSCNKAVILCCTNCAMPWLWPSAVVGGCVSDSCRGCLKEIARTGSKDTPQSVARVGSRTSKIGRSQF